MFFSNLSCRFSASKLWNFHYTKVVVLLRPMLSCSSTFFPSLF